jgi:signal transduction histidine kinase/CheY-like chemotaxis protein
MRLKYILFLALSGVAVLPILALAFWIFSQAQAREERLVQDTHLLLARNLGAALERYSRDVRSGFELAADAAMRDGLSSRRSVITLLQDLNFIHLCIANKDTGRVVGGVFPEDFPCPDVVPAKRFAAFKALIRDEAPVFSPVMANPHGQPTIYLLMIREDNLVIGAISTEYFVERGAAISFGKLGHAAIVDQTGTVLAHPKPDWIAEMRNIAQVSAVAAMLRGETGITTFFSPALQADMIAGYTVVPSTGWGVMIPQPLAEVREHVGSLQNWAMTISGLAILVAAAISWVLAGLLSRGLTPITAAATRMSMGDLAARVSPPKGFRPRELAELAAAFNKMGEAIDTGNRQLSNALIDAEQAAQAKTNFLTTITHEIRTPMNGVVGVAEMLDETELSAEQKEMVAVINHSAGALLTIVNDVLDISKIEAGQLELDETTFSPRAVAEEVMQEMLPAANTKTLSLTVDVAPDVPAWIRSDKTRLWQILVNLTNNAIKFTESGFVRIAVRRHIDADGSDVLSVSVQDTGIGINTSVIDRLFEPFSQADAAIARKYGGTGLGLSICKRLAELLGGHMTVSSVIGDGSTFRVVLPLKEVHTSEADPDVAQPAAEMSPDREIKDGRRRVLVAEDHSTNLWILRRQLEDLGFEVDCHESGQGALAAFRDQSYDLIITDYLMPDIDGIGLTRAVRSLEVDNSLKMTPILGLTANAFRDAIDRCLEAGMNVVLTKPVNKTTLGRTIEDLLKNGTGRLLDADVQSYGSIEPEPGVPFDSTSLHTLFGDQPSEGRAWLADFLVGLEGKLRALDMEARPEGRREAQLALLHGLSGIAHAAGASELGDLARSSYDTLRDDPDARFNADDMATIRAAAERARNGITQELRKT